MAAGRSDPNELRVLVLAPVGRDGALAAHILAERARLATKTCASTAELCAAIDEGAGAVVIAEEATDEVGGALLTSTLHAQPPWSDLSIIVLLNRSEMRSSTHQIISALHGRGNVTLLERPIRIVTLVSAAQSALRARRRQYEVRDLLAQTRTAVRQRDQFLAMLGHELRNPLSTIVNALGVLDAACPAADETEREHREMIGRQARHLARLVDDLLDVERITSGKVTLRLDTVEIATLARRAVQAVDGWSRAQRHEVVVTAPPHPVYVNGDAVRLEQVVNNLLANAIKYTPPGGRIVVTVATTPDGNAELSVRDNGIGISPELLPRVFDLFEQAERSLDRSQGGLGIGLTLVRSLVEMHGGTVDARSDGLDRGSEFRVALPLATGPATAATPLWAAESDRTPATARSNGGLRVLVIEDHDDARRVIQRLLTLWGHTVHVASEGHEGVRVANAVRPHVALVDIGLPGIDGYEVARQIRAGGGGNAVRLIALTGYGQPEDEARARAAGFNQHLVKPVSTAQLAEMLDRCARISQD